MTLYQAPVDDTLFALRAVAAPDATAAYPGDDVVASILTEAGRFAEGVLLPLNQIGDKGCTLKPNGQVHTPPGFPDAFRRFTEAGWTTLVGPEEYGGQALPNTLGAAVQEYWISANMGFAQYGVLTHSAMATVLAAASPAQKALYLPKLISGEWTGAMSLTEPHCGTDLGLIRTKAVQQPDGSYAITGTKIFISAGEQDLTENIVHLVLARVEGAPTGPGGLSLFIVPKRLIKEDGRLGNRNAILCSSLEHKMGLKASATCVLNFDRACGFLVGKEGKGLANMFIMMNETRLTTGVQGVAMAEVAYQNAAAYAKDRRQGRSAAGPADPQAEADPILVHADVRRMLLGIRSFTQSARALTFWAASLVDRSHLADLPEERANAAALVAWLTPIVKGYLTDICLQCTIDAQQVFGGHGYIADHGMEQFVRDARISMIYEGTNGIQAMDLVGRKLIRDGGKTFAAYAELVRDDLVALAQYPDMADIHAGASNILADCEAGAGHLLQAANDPDSVGGVATSFMHLAGSAALAHMWIKLVLATLRSEGHVGEKRQARLALAAYFIERAGPVARSHRMQVETGAGALGQFRQEWF